MHVEHIMTKNPVACDASTTLLEAARLMREKGVGCVVVLQQGKVVGLVTDRQLTVEGLASGKGPEAPVSEVMTANPATLTLDDNIFSAIDTMRSAGVARRIPVVNAEKELLGLVSISDIALVAKDLVDAVLLEETHHAMQETRVLTGAKRFVDVMRRPTKAERLPRQQEIRPVTSPTPPGPSASGGAGQPPPGALARVDTETPRAEREERKERPGVLGSLFGKREE